MKESLRRYLSGVGFVDGAGSPHASHLEALANLLLVEDGVRISYLMQQEDYKRVSEARKTMSIIIEAGYGFAEVDQGTLFFLPKNRRKVESQAETYERTGDDSYLAKALSFPTTGPMPDPGTERKVASFRAKRLDTGEEAEFMAVVLKAGASDRACRDFCDKCAEALEPHGMAVRLKVSKLEAM